MNKEILDVIDTSVTDWGIDLINAPSFWSKTLGEGVKVAVIDTGIDYTHPDLSHAIKDVIDLKYQKGDVRDEYGHGTHVAGLVAGKYTGVAPNVDLYIAKVMDERGIGYMRHVMDGITFAINFEVDILCMSLGINSELPIFVKQAITNAYNKGITIVSATGNTGRKGVQYPAFYEEVIGVGGIDKDLKRASFSTYGDGCDVVAPAVNILSTWKDNNYARMTGTSMASPLVAGAIALMISYYRKQGIELTQEQIREKLSLLGNGKTKEYGYGILDLSKLLAD